jgi:hypothetical protein
MKTIFGLLPLLLFASVNEPLRLELLTGYRNDDIHWHLGSSYGEHYKNVQFWENELALRSIHRDIVIYARGGYGAFGQGTLHQDPSMLTFRTDGWALDGVAHFGYAANLTPDRLYRAMVIPLVGFSGHYEQLKPKSYQQTLYGPYLGGAIRVEPGNRLLFEAGYAFNWLHVKISDQFVQFSGWGNYGHSGWLQVDVELGQYWQLGLFGQIDYVYSNLHPIGSEELKLRWTPISGMFTLSYQL